MLVAELCSFIRKIASIFLDTYSLNIGLLPVLGLGLFQILFQMHSFSNNNIVFSGGGWSENFYFPAEFRLKIFLWIFLDFSIWHFCCQMYLLSGWCLSNFRASMQALNTYRNYARLLPEMLLASNVQPMLCSYMLCLRFKCKISLLFWTIVLFSQYLAGKNGSCFIVSKELHSLLS